MAKLSFWALPNDPVEGSRLIQKEISIFTELTNIEVELIEIPWGKIWEYLINSVKGNNKPDVVQIGSSWVSILSAINYLADITDIVNSNEFIFNISPKIRNRYYAIPWFLDIALLFYKNSKIKDTSIESLDDFLSICKKHKQEVLALGGKKEHILLQYISSFVWGSGGNYTVNNYIDLTTGKNFEGIKLFFDILNKYGIKDLLTNKYGDVLWDFFLRDRGIFCFANIWTTRSFIKAHKKESVFTAVNIPCLNSSNCNFVGGSCLGIVKGTKMFDESKEFIKFLTSNLSQKRYISFIGMIPVRKETFNKVIDNFLFPDAITKAIKNGRTYPPVPFWGSFEEIFVNSIYNIFQLIKHNKYTHQRLKRELNLTNKKINFLIDLWKRK